MLGPGSKPPAKVSKYITHVICRLQQSRRNGQCSVGRAVSSFSCRVLGPGALHGCSGVHAVRFELPPARPQMLVMASRHSKGALRAVHVPSRTVFANWPTPATPLAYVHCAAFSPGGGLLAVGTSKGRALLYRLNHYPSA